MSPGVKLVTGVTRGLGLGLRFELGLGYQVTKGSTRLSGYSGSVLVPILPVSGQMGQFASRTVGNEKIGTKMRRKGTKRKTSRKGTGKKKGSQREARRCERENVGQGGETLNS